MFPKGGRGLESAKRILMTDGSPYLSKAKGFLS